MPAKRSIGWIAIYNLACLCCVSLITGPSLLCGQRPADGRHDLHANLRAETGWHGDSRFETLTFQLTNDSDRVLNSATDSWVLVIDDKQWPDPGGQLWMGGKPTGGYDTVSPGQTYQFGKALPLQQYFPEPRDYRVYWKAAGFRSNVVLVKGKATQ
jgi:hypothetical protein